MKALGGPPMTGPTGGKHWPARTSIGQFPTPDSTVKRLQVGPGQSLDACGAWRTTTQRLCAQRILTARSLVSFPIRPTGWRKPCHLSHGRYHHLLHPQLVCRRSAAATTTASARRPHANADTSVPDATAPIASGSAHKLGPAALGHHTVLPPILSLPHLVQWDMGLPDLSDTLLVI